MHSCNMQPPGYFWLPVNGKFKVHVYSMPPPHSATLSNAPLGRMLQSEHIGQLSACQCNCRQSTCNCGHDGCTSDHLGLLVSVMHAQWDARLTVTSPAYAGAKFILLGLWQLTAQDINSIEYVPAFAWHNFAPQSGFVPGPVPLIRPVNMYFSLVVVHTTAMLSRQWLVGLACINWTILLFLECRHGGVVNTLQLQWSRGKWEC